MHKEQLAEYVLMMRSKSGSTSPGWKHFRVLCDYIRDAVAAGKVTYQELGLRGELGLLKLELSCVRELIADGKATLIEESLERALNRRIEKLEGHNKNETAVPSVIEFFPDNKPAVKAA